MAWPSSLKREANRNGGGTGASSGMGAWFRHGQGVEKLLLPDGITSTGSTQEEVILALCHYNVGTLHGSQLSCVGRVSRRWGLMKEKKVLIAVNQTINQSINHVASLNRSVDTHWDGDTAASCEASTSIKATVHHHC